MPGRRHGRGAPSSARAETRAAVDSTWALLEEINPAARRGARSTKRRLHTAQRVTTSTSNNDVYMYPTEASSSRHKAYAMLDAVMREGEKALAEAEHTLCNDEPPYRHELVMPPQGDAFAGLGGAPRIKPAPVPGPGAYDVAGGINAVRPRAVSATISSRRTVPRVAKSQAPVLGPGDYGYPSCSLTKPCSRTTTLKAHRYAGLVGCGPQRALAPSSTAAAPHPVPGACRARGLSHSAPAQLPRAIDAACIRTWSGCIPTGLLSGGACCAGGRDKAAPITSPAEGSVSVRRSPPLPSPPLAFPHPPAPWQ